MAPLVTGMSRDEMRELADYFSTQKPPRQKFAASADKAKLGKAKSEETLCTMYHLGAEPAGHRCAGMQTRGISSARTASPRMLPSARGRNPEHAVFSPNGKIVFVSAEDGGAVDIIDVQKRQQVAQVPAGARPRGDTGTNTKVADVPVGKLPWGVAIR